LSNSELASRPWPSGHGRFCVGHTVGHTATHFAHVRAQRTRPVCRPPVESSLEQWPPDSESPAAPSPGIRGDVSPSLCVR
jgi:hypothetical protein